MRLVHFFITLSAFLLMAGLNIAVAQVYIDPFGIAVSMEATDSTGVELTLINEGDSDIHYKIGFCPPPDEERRGIGPQRDQPESTFLLIQDRFAWQYWNYTILNEVDAEFDQISSRDLGDVDLTDYDIAIFSSMQLEYYYRDYNNHSDEFEEWVDQGGVLDWHTATDQWNIIPELPGGLQRFRQVEPWNVCTTSPEDNYFVQLCNENYDLDVDTRIQGGTCSSTAFSEDHLERLVEDEIIDEYEVIFIGEGNEGENPTLVVYPYGRGTVVAVGINWEYLRRRMGEHEWPWAGHLYDEFILYLDYLASPKWVTSDTEEGVIEEDNSDTFNIIFMTEEMEEGVYERMVEIECTEVDDHDSLDVNIIMISTLMSVGAPVANIAGTITDAENDNPIEDAELDFTGYYYARFTDENGTYTADNIPLGDYEITISATDFLTTVEDLSVDEAGEFEWNIDLFHSECTPSQNRFIQQLAPGMEYDFNFTIENGGNGPLTYVIDRRLLGDANTEPFDLRQTDEIEGDLEDNFLAGAVFADEHFYISGGNNGSNPNKIYILNMEREIVDEFDQFTDDRYGMRDLTFDGELIWGAVQGTFYGFTTDGNLDKTFEFIPVNGFEGRCFAWDTED
ncbi:MAG: carboxypeptidase regulatory-like domain-containing protein, partial [Calditrichaeota bacterium]|nr:carboxypeptidase regulatory-like domain-containing protein [Calditrichota bacterium]